MFLTPLFSERAASSYAWESLYCGYRYESATGVFHVRNRVYHPVMGTWVQRDPLGYVDGMSVYAYLKGFVLTLSDPGGLAAPLIVGAVAVAVVGAGLCWHGSCKNYIRTSLIEAEALANKNSPDGTTHNYNAANRQVTDKDGGGADALTHCIAACELARNPGWACLRASTTLFYLNGREDANKPGDEIDIHNNTTGNSLGLNLKPGESCLSACQTAYKDGKLLVIDDSTKKPRKSP